MEIGPRNKLVSFENQNVQSYTDSELWLEFLQMQESGLANIHIVRP